MDRQQAIEMFLSALSVGISMEQLVEEVRNYLADKANIDLQVIVVRNLGIWNL